MGARSLRNCFAGLGAFAALGVVALNLSPAAHAAAIADIASFNSTNGADPEAGVTIDSSGNLYGTTYGGGSAGDGTVWEIPVGSNTITTLASFPGGAGGANPRGGVTMDSAGNLFGTASAGGPNVNAPYGTVWEIAKGTSTLTTFAVFSGFGPGMSGADPWGGITMDSRGNLFGTARQGGTSGEGTVWEIAKGSAAMTALASFTGSPQGAEPRAGVTLDDAGDIFGTTYFGGDSAGDGTVWEIVHGTSVITTLAQFNGANGAQPLGMATLDSSGNLFGTTQLGGSAGKGTVWEIVQGSNAITTLVNFTGPDGSAPYGGVTLDAVGNLYGTTAGGGASNKGTLFEIAHGTTTLTTLASFNSTNGYGPDAGVTLDGSGNLFGTAHGGGATGNGVVFGLSSLLGGHTHLLWDNVSGQASLWTVNSDNTYASAVYGPFGGWTARATAAAPDGTNWLLWTNTSGQISLWHVTALTANGYTATQYGPYANYQAVSLSIGSDGNPRLLWDKTDGTALLWTVNPATGAFTYTTYGPFAGYTANQVASGPAVTDLLWTSTNGTAVGWRIAPDGSHVTAVYGPFSGYTAVGLSVGPDNGAHLLWDSTSGAASLWNADFAADTYTYTAYGPFSGYAARAIATGLDNATHLLWDNTNSTASLWNVVGSGYTHYEYGPFSGWTAVAVSAGP